MAGEPRPSDGRLRRDLMFVAGAQVLTVVSAFALTVVAARMLGGSRFGTLSWVLSWLAFLGVIAQFGLGQLTTVRLGGPAKPTDLHVLDRLAMAQVTMSVGAALVWLVAVGPLVVSLSNDSSSYRPLIVVVAVWIPVAAAGPVIVAGLRARGRFAASSAFGDHVRRIMLIAVLLAMRAIDPTIDVRSAALWAAAFETAAFVYGFVLLRSGVRPTTMGHADQTQSSDTSMGIVRQASAFAIPAITSITIPQAGVWMLAFFDSSTQVGVLAVAARVAVLLAAPGAIGLRAFAPRIVHANEVGTLQSLEPSLRRFTTLAGLLTLAAAAAIPLFGPWVMPLVFGEVYSDAVVPAAVLSIGYLVNVATGPCTILLSHTGRTRIVSQVAIWAAVMFIALTLALSGPLGATGVAIAAAVTMSGRNIFLAIVVKRSMGMVTTPSIGTVRTR